MMEKVTSPQERFEGLYAEHRLDVLAYCTRRMNADAADACSETFLVAWRRIEDIPSPPGTLPYLYGIAGRIIANQLRALRRRSRLEEKLRSLGVAPAPQPSVLIVQSPQDQKVMAALSRLKPKDREIVMLYTWEELPRNAIAEMMGMTRDAIDQRIHRSYLRLARILEISSNPRPVPSPPIAEKEGT